MDDKVRLGGFSGLSLVDFIYHIDWSSYEDSYIELIASGNGGKRHLRFLEPSSVEIAHGFNGSLSGMAVLDISSRQWSRISIEVVNCEQDPGITFYARSMEILRDDVSTPHNGIADTQVR